METTLRYLAASTNRSGHAAAISHNQSIVAFASHKFVALWKLSQGKGIKVYNTLVGYAGDVTCVRFAFGRDDRIIAADDQGWLYLHSLENSGWQLAAKTQAHHHSIAALCDRQGIIATGSSDATIKIWTVDETRPTLNLKHHQTLQIGGRFPLDCQIAQLPGVSNYILAVASTERILRIYIYSEGQFIQALTLSGHEDWIRSLAFSAVGSSQSLLLASGSQDGTIRIWSVTPTESTTTMAPLGYSDFSVELLNAFEASLGDMGDEEGGRQISTKRHVLAVKEGESLRQFQVEFDALLIGHEASVTSLSWRPGRSPSSTPMLLSTSVDSSVILWAPASFRTGVTGQDATLWINQQRFGDVGGQRLGGFVGGIWAGDGNDAMAWGWNGGWRRWTCPMSEPETWVEVPAATGHAGPVHGLDWSPNGEYLITTSVDQTTRIHGDAGDEGWHELARPQIHGYDCLDARFITQLRFVSIGDEKVARVFDAPRRFVDTLTGLHVSNFEDIEGRPAAATLPPLGLSNKAAQLDEDESKPTDEHPTIMRVPFESELATGTLWPEIEKMFGHGYESIALAVSNARTLIATACKSTTPEHALIRLYDTERFLPYGEPLSGHSLTVVRIAFNRDDRFILSVSKDRTWCLFERTKDGYKLCSTAKAHTRIIWDCTWMREEDVFVTAGRDKQVKVWAMDGPGTSNFKCVSTLKMSGGATAVAMSKMDENGQRLLAVGFETGGILIYSSKSHDNWEASHEVPSNEAPVGHIRVLAWRERKMADGTIERHLATCSDDRSVRIIQVLST